MKKKPTPKKVAAKKKPAPKKARTKQGALKSPSSGKTLSGKEKTDGRKRNFETPEDMSKAWEQYKEYVRDVMSKEWPRVQYVGKEGMRVVDYPKLPYTLEGFYRFCRPRIGEVHQYFDNVDKVYDMFLGVCTRIREEILEDMKVGGIINAYNPSFTARVAQLADSIQQTHIEQPLFPKANKGTTEGL